MAQVRTVMSDLITVINRHSQTRPGHSLIVPPLNINQQYLIYTQPYHAYKVCYMTGIVFIKCKSHMNFEIQIYSFSLNTIIFKYGPIMSTIWSFIELTILTSIVSMVAKDTSNPYCLVSFVNICIIIDRWVGKFFFKNLTCCKSILEIYKYLSDIDIEIVS